MALSLVTPEDVRALVNTSLSDIHLQDVIDRVEAEITAKIGAPQEDGMTVSQAVTKRGEGTLLFTPVEIYSVVSIVEDETTLEATDYQVWAGGVIERLPMGSTWGDRNIVTFKAVDDRLKRKQAVIDLVRIVIERTAMQSESIAGEYQYTAPDNWEAEFRRIMKRLTYLAI